MTSKRGKLPLLAVVFFMLALTLVVGMMYVVYSNGKVLGAPGGNVNLLNNLRYSIRLYRNLEGLQQPVVFPGQSERKFIITNSDGARDVCGKLERDQFVFSGTNICDFLIYKGKDRTLSPGTYTIQSGLNPIQIAMVISDSTNRDLQFTIFAGWRLEEIAAVIDQLGFEFGADEFLNLVYAAPADIAQIVGLPEARSLEGYLHPGFYSLKPTIRLEDFVREAVLKTQTVIEEGAQLLNAQSATLASDELIKLASILQRETQDSTEMPLIASVFYNRLAIDMRLETDPTVQYALGFDPATQTWWKAPLTFNDLAVESDYNTYKVQGLPPGPICSPGREAILAAFAPEQTGYYFFRAKCDGSLTHNFAVTYEEHLENGCE